MHSIKSRSRCFKSWKGKRFQKKHSNVTLQHFFLNQMCFFQLVLLCFFFQRFSIDGVSLLLNTNTRLGMLMLRNSSKTTRSVLFTNTLNSAGMYIASILAVIFKHGPTEIQLVTGAGVAV